MTDRTTDLTTEGRAAAGTKAGRFFGSLRDALAAAGRADQADSHITGVERPTNLLTPPPVPPGGAAPVVVTKRSTDVVDLEEVLDDVKGQPIAQAVSEVPQMERVSAKEAADAARGHSEAVPRVVAASAVATDRHVEFETPPTTGVVKRGGKPAASGTVDTKESTPDQTQLVRGRADVKRGAFEKDPVVGWLVVVGGPGLGNYRPIFEGNNTVGRDSSQRIAIDFGDDAISSKEQAYIRYDSAERNFLFVPNLSKTNIVSVNDKRPTGAVPLAAMDVITIGRTQLVFVPFCGADFDWSELPQS